MCRCLLNVCVHPVCLLMSYWSEQIIWATQIQRVEKQTLLLMQWAAKSHCKRDNTRKENHMAFLQSTTDPPQPQIIHVLLTCKVCPLPSQDIQNSHPITAVDLKSRISWPKSSPHVAPLDSEKDGLKRQVTNPHAPNIQQWDKDRVNCNRPSHSKMERMRGT